MAYVNIDCPNPFDGRPVRLKANIATGSQAWCDDTAVVDAYRAAFTALGRAWWDVMHAWHGVSGTPWALPWVVSPVIMTSDGLAQVETHGMDITAVVDGSAYLAPRGYPPNASFQPSAEQDAAVREELQLVFGRHSMLSTDDFAHIYRALEAAYFGLLKNRPNVRCAVRNCIDSGVHTDIAWYGAGWTNICQAFFTYSPTIRAATMAEEWLHQFGEVLHAGTPAIDEADNYAAFLRAAYLT